MTVTVQKVGGVLRKAGFERSRSSSSRNPSGTWRTSVTSGYVVSRGWNGIHVSYRASALQAAEAKRPQMLAAYQAALEAVGLSVWLDSNGRLVVTSPEEGEAS